MDTTYIMIVKQEMLIYQKKVEQNVLQRNTMYQEAVLGNGLRNTKRQEK